MLFRSEIIEGIKIILKLFVNASGAIAIEKNKPEAIAAMEKAAAKEKKISVHPLRTKYPQGGEKSLVKAITGIDTTRAALPASVGCIVCNVGTIYAIYRAVCYREPLYRRAVSVTGDAIADPCNLIVRNGTQHQRELSDEEVETLRILEVLTVKNRTRLLAFAYELEEQQLRGEP